MSMEMQKMAFLCQRFFRGFRKRAYQQEGLFSVNSFVKCMPIQRRMESLSPWKKVVCVVVVAFEGLLVL